MPNVSGRALNHETRRYVEEYTWNIFCILADIIDVMLIKLNIPVIVHDNVPAGLGGSSSAFTVNIKLFTVKGLVKNFFSYIFCNLILTELKFKKF